jgi:hypothetical protein
LPSGTRFGDPPVQERRDERQAQEGGRGLGHEAPARVVDQLRADRGGWRAKASRETIEDLRVA